MPAGQQKIPGRPSSLSRYDYRNDNTYEYKKKNINDASPRQAALIADAATGMSKHQLAQKYGVSRDTVTRWIWQFDIAMPETQSMLAHRRALPETTSVALSEDFPPVQIVNPSYDNPKPMGEQLLDYLQSNLTALVSQLGIATDPDWLRKQDAAGLAALHRTVGDRFDRLLASFIAGQQQLAESQEDPEDLE